MEKPNAIRDKSFAFALATIELYKFCIQKKEFIMSKQILKSGTSIGANVEEALQGQSRKDFISKLSISLKEAHETRYWLRLLKSGGYLSGQQFVVLLRDIEELIKLLTAIIKKTKE